MTKQRLRDTADLGVITCRSKTAHPSARIAAIRADERSRVIGSPIWHYRCRYCKLWHLTSVPQREAA